MRSRNFSSSSVSTISPSFNQNDKNLELQFNSLLDRFTSKVLEFHFDIFLSGKKESTTYLANYLSNLNKIPSYFLSFSSYFYSWESLIIANSIEYISETLLIKDYIDPLCQFTRKQLDQSRGKNSSEERYEPKRAKRGQVIVPFPSIDKSNLSNEEELASVTVNYEIHGENTYMNYPLKYDYIIISTRPLKSVSHDNLISSADYIALSGVVTGVKFVSNIRLLTIQFRLGQLKKFISNVKECAKDQEKAHNFLGIDDDQQRLDFLKSFGREGSLSYLHYTVLVNLRPFWREYRAIYEMNQRKKWLPFILNLEKRYSNFSQSSLIEKYLTSLNDIKVKNENEPLNEEQRISFENSNIERDKLLEDYVINTFRSKLRESSNISSSFIDYLISKLNIYQLWAVTEAITSPSINEYSSNSTSPLPLLLISGEENTGKSSLLCYLSNMFHLLIRRSNHDNLFEWFISYEGQKIKNLHSSYIESKLLTSLNNLLNKKTRILITAPSIFHCDYLVKKIETEVWLDGNNQFYVPRIIYMHDLDKSNEFLRLEDLKNTNIMTIPALMMRELEEIRSKNNSNIDTSTAFYELGMKELNNLISLLIKDAFHLQSLLLTLQNAFVSYYPLPRQAELRVNPQTYQAYWVDHEKKMTYAEPPWALNESIEKQNETKYKTVQGLPEYIIYSKKLIDLLQQLINLNSKRNRLQSIISAIQDGIGPDNYPPSTPPSSSTFTLLDCHFIFASLPLQTRQSLVLSYLTQYDIIIGPLGVLTSGMGGHGQTLSSDPDLNDLLIRECCPGISLSSILSEYVGTDGGWICLLDDADRIGGSNFDEIEKALEEYNEEELGDEIINIDTVKNNLYEKNNNNIGLNEGSVLGLFRSFNITKLILLGNPLRIEEEKNENIFLPYTSILTDFYSLRQLPRVWKLNNFKNEEIHSLDRKDEIINEEIEYNLNLFKEPKKLNFNRSIFTRLLDSGYQTICLSTNVEDELIRRNILLAEGRDNERDESRNISQYFIKNEFTESESQSFNQIKKIKLENS